MRKKAPRSPLAEVLVFCLAIAGCGDGDGQKGPADGNVDAVDTGPVAAFVAAYCEILRPCCAMAGLPTDGVTCQRGLGAVIPAAAYDPQAGEACLAALRTQAAGPEFCRGLPSPEACGKAFAKGPHNKQPGESCQSDGDCAASTLEGTMVCALKSVPGGPVRTCQAQLRGKAGDRPCVATVDGTSASYPAITGAAAPQAYLCHVGDGLRCDEKSFACVTLKQPGEACARPSAAGSTSSPTIDEDCVKGSYCDPNQRVCLARKAIAAACSTFTNRAECTDDAYCSEAVQACSPRVDDLGACTKDLECRSERCVQGQCESQLAVFCGRK